TRAPAGCEPPPGCEPPHSRRSGSRPGTRSDVESYDSGMAEGRLYFDHHATTPVDPAVVAAMLPYFTERFGNPSSRGHGYGDETHLAGAEARARIARPVGAPAGGPRVP